MNKIPKFWRKFKQQMTAQDLLMGRKTLVAEKGKLVIRLAKKPLTNAG